MELLGMISSCLQPGLCSAAGMIYDLFHTSFLSPQPVDAEQSPGTGTGTGMLVFVEQLVGSKVCDLSEQQWLVSPVPWAGYQPGWVRRIFPAQPPKQK